MRFSSRLAASFLLVQIASGISNLAVYAQGMYGAGDQVPLPRRHSNNFSQQSSPTRQSTDSESSGMAADTNLIVPASGQQNALSPPIQKAKPPSNEGSPLHDLDRTTDPWFCDEQKQALMKKKIATETQNIIGDPARATPYIARADGYLHLKRSQEALEDSNKALELTQDKVLRGLAYTNRAEALLQMKKYHEALTDLLRAISLDDENADAIYFRGMARERLGQMEMAVKDYLVARDLGFAPKGVKVNYEPYMAEIQRKIKSNWRPQWAAKTNKTIALFRVLRNGTMENPRIESESGTPESDAAALAALNASAPFPPLPKGAPKHVDISFNFDYNVRTGRNGELMHRDSR